MKQFNYEVRGGNHGNMIRYPDDEFDVDGNLIVDGIQYWSGATIRGDIVVGEYSGPSELADWVPPVPEPIPQPLTKLAFSDLLQGAGGMTDAMLVASRDDVQLRPMWIKFELAADVERDHPQTQAGLTALEGLGYLPTGAQAVIDAWPAV